MHTRYGTTIDKQPLTSTAGESANYLNQGRDQLYYVAHQACGRRIGQVLLAGPFGAENEPMHVAWVRWARYLASRGLDVFRFDYRGVGESTGEFEHMDLNAWMSDLRLCCRKLPTRDVPFVLHGLGLGALLAARAFDDGIGDALLLWSPPPDAREVLEYWLRRQMAAGYCRWSSAARLSRRECIDAMENGRPVPVDGYVWSPELWRQSATLRFIEPSAGNNRRTRPGRPHRIVNLQQNAGPLFLPWGEMPTPRTAVDVLNPDLTHIFQQDYDWIQQSAAVIARDHATDSAA